MLAQLEPLPPLAPDRREPARQVWPQAPQELQVVELPAPVLRPPVPRSWLLQP